MLNNQKYRNNRFMAAALKRARNARGGIVGKRDLKAIVKWIRHPTLEGLLFDEGIGRICFVGRWPRVHVVDTVVYPNINGEYLMHQCDQIEGEKND